MSSAPIAGPTAELLIRFEGWVKRLPLGSEPVVLGRSNECDVTLPDPALSRQHCRIAPDGDGWTLEDLGSRAGTFIDGARAETPAPLEPSSRVRIGSTSVQLRPARSGVLSGDLSRDERNVELLLKTLGELQGADGSGELLRTILDRAILVAGGERGALLLAAPGGKLEAGLARDASGRDLAPEEVLSRSLPDRALQSRSAVLLTDSEDPEQREAAPHSVVASGLRSVLCVPMPGPGRSAGVLYIDSSRPADDFGPADLATLEALGVHGALAIERSRLREDQRRREAEERGRLERENTALRNRLELPPPIGESTAMRHVFDVIRRFAPSDATVCLTGETGTGKEVIARHLHAQSTRAAGPFVVIDCGAMPPGLIESELFGHQEGAFTGASGSRKGLFRSAQGGTVFLDEVGELPLDLQTRLLRVLQERTVQPVGSVERVPVDVRVICATHRDLTQRVADGTFRQDLFYRIGMLTVPIPPLREREDDILLLARHFLARFAASYGTGLTGFTREAVEALLEHPWPGNVRELEHRLQRAVLLATPPFVTRRDLALSAQDDGGRAEPAESDLSFQPLQEARAGATERFEKAYLEEALGRSGGRITEAAALAGVSRQLFQRLLKRHGIDKHRFAAAETGD